ncbi:uncharacterized protein [Henckelia pumila]|uniref:uncharacterized protein n=1 Tax=Henckelia pumila TaxID=405737 RepID=UPI003C6E0747
MLCEIKDGDDDITIPVGHVDDESRKYKRTEANDRLRKWVQNMPDVCSVDESEDDSEDEKYDPAVRDGGVDVAGSAVGSLEMENQDSRNKELTSKPILSKNTSKDSNKTNQQSEGRSNARWNTFLSLKFVDLCEEEILLGNRPNGHLMRIDEKI